MEYQIIIRDNRKGTVDIIAAGEYVEGSPAAQVAKKLETHLRALAQLAGAIACAGGCDCPECTLARAQAPSRAIN